MLFAPPPLVIPIMSISFCERKALAAKMPPKGSSQPFFKIKYSQCCTMDNYDQRKNRLIFLFCILEYGQI